MATKKKKKKKKRVAKKRAAKKRRPAKKKKPARRKKRAKKVDRPWWGKGHTLWGGETFKSKQTKGKLGVENGDLFRIEQDSAGVHTLIPHPQNKGTWKDTHDAANPIVLNDFPFPPFEKSFSMMVSITKDSAPKELFLFETVDEGAIAITDDIRDPGQDGSTASVER
jgi:hypothetical protein